MSSKPVTIKTLLNSILVTVAITFAIFIALFIHHYITLQTAYAEQRFKHAVSVNVNKIAQEITQAKQNLYRFQEYAQILLRESTIDDNALKSLQYMMANSLQFSHNQHSARIALTPDNAKRFFNQPGFFMNIHKNHTKRNQADYNQPDNMLSESRYDTDYMQDKAYQLAQHNTALQTSQIYFDDSYLKAWVLTMSLGLFDTQGQLQGIVATDILMDNLFAAIEQSIFGETGGLFLVDHQSGLLLTQVETREQVSIGIVGKKARLTHNLYEQADQRQWKSVLKSAVESQAIKGANRRWYQIATQPFDNPSWALVVYQARSELQKDLHLGLFVLIFLSCAAFTAIAVIGLLLILKVVQPLEKLVEVMRQLKHTPAMNLQAPVTGTLETHLLGDIFNDLLTSIKQAVAEKDRFAQELQAYSHTLEQKVAQRTEELAAAVAEAQAANRSKSQFLANMSHEIRTPMNAIIGYTEMLQDDAEDMDCPQFVPELQKINAAALHLLSLINDILDLSKIEAGKMELYLERFSIPQMVDEIAMTVRLLLEKRGNDLVVDCPTDIEEMYADLTKVRQNLLNLISNANKFSQNQTIELQISRQTDAANNFICFSVRDYGIGMTETQLARLFEAFVQADAATTRHYGGTGLGLAITKHFCEMMGGAIKVESRYGEGSTFSMYLPERVCLEP